MSYLFVGLMTSVIASVCCLGPLFLLSTGLSAAWISHMMPLETYHPIFATATVITFGIVGRQINWSSGVDDSTSSGEKTLSHAGLRTGYLVLCALALILITSVWWIQFLG